MGKRRKYMVCHQISIRPVDDAVVEWRIYCVAAVLRARLCLRSFSLVMAVYLLMLSWYAVFFCTRLLLFAVVLLTISIILCFIVFVTMRKTLLLISAVTIIIEIIQIYFVWFTFNAHR